MWQTEKKTYIGKSIFLYRDSCAEKNCKQLLRLIQDWKCSGKFAPFYHPICNYNTNIGTLDNLRVKWDLSIPYLNMWYTKLQISNNLSENGRGFQGFLERAIISEMSLGAVFDSLDPWLYAKNYISDFKIPAPIIWNGLGFHNFSSSRHDYRWIEPWCRFWWARLCHMFKFIDMRITNMNVLHHIYPLKQ